MDISLTSRTDTTAWSSLFQILGYDLCIPIWDILDIPPNVLNNTTRILEISKFFFTRGGEIPVEKELSSDKEVSNYLEAYRMMDLGHLYKCFGKIVAYYGEETAIHLFKLGEIHFVGEISRYWDDWHLLFSKLLKKNLSPSIFLSQEVHKQLLDIIKFHFEEEADKSEKLKIRFEQMCQRYSSNLEEERDKLNQLMSYDIRNSEFTNEEGFENICDELDWVFAFDLLLLQDCPYKIWRDFNAVCEETSREKFFQFGVKELTLIDKYYDKKLEKLKDYYLTI